jgi:hypothetical protein
MKRKIFWITLTLLLNLVFCLNLNSQTVLITKKSNPVIQESFKHIDIGNPTIPGRLEKAEDGFDISASGADIWGSKDEFSLVYYERKGNFDFATRIESLTDSHQYTKAGIMVREDLNAGSKNVFFLMFPDNQARNKNNGGYEFQYRKEVNGQMEAIYPEKSKGDPEFPVSYPNAWIRLQRSGNEFTSYYSTDGTFWKVYTKFTLSFPEKVYLGLAVTSHNPKKQTTAKYRNIREYLKY